MMSNFSNMEQHYIEQLFVLSIKSHLHLLHLVVLTNILAYIKSRNQVQGTDIPLQKHCPLHMHMCTKKRCGVGPHILRYI